MKRTIVGGTGRTILLAALPAVSLVLGASGCSGPEADETQLAAKGGAVAVCHHADGGRWVPLRVPEVAAETLVAHGDFFYDASAGQCCTEGDCPSGQPCNIIVGDHGNPIGVCGPTPPSTITTDPVGLLLAVGLFGTSSGAIFPFTGVLSRDTANHYFFSYTVRGTNAQVQLTSFTFTGTALAPGSQTPVDVTFPTRLDGLITVQYDNPYADYLNFSVSAPALPLNGSAKLDVDNGEALYDVSDFFASVDLDSGQHYDLNVLGIYTPPYVGPYGGRFPAGTYFNMPNGSTTVNVMVFRGEAYGVSIATAAGH